MTPGKKIRSRQISAFLAMMLLTAFSGMQIRELRADAQVADRQIKENQQPTACEPIAIQGRITEIQGALVTVKTPEGFPGARGGHAQYVTAGPTFRINISRARVLLPDGRQLDKVPLAVGDHVLVLLTGPDLGRQEPANVSRTYFASIVERIVQSDKIVTH